MVKHTGFDWTDFEEIVTFGNLQEHAAVLDQKETREERNGRNACNMSHDDTKRGWNDYL